MVVLVQLKDDPECNTIKNHLHSKCIQIDDLILLNIFGMISLIITIVKFISFITRLRIT